MGLTEPAFLEAEYLAHNRDIAEAVAGGRFSSGWEHYQRHARIEGRTHSPEEGLTRRDKVFFGVDRAGLGLEIGTSHNPVAPKREGFNVHIVDHLGTEELRAKYVDHDVEIHNIEDVDFVWSGAPLAETVGAPSAYDWIIATWWSTYPTS